MFTLKWKLGNLVRIDCWQIMGQYEKNLFGFYKDCHVHSSFFSLLPTPAPYFREIYLIHLFNKKKDVRTALNSMNIFECLPCELLSATSISTKRNMV